MKNDYFDPELEPDTPLLPEDPAEALTEPSEAETQDASGKPAKRQLLGYDLSTLLIAGAALIALAIYAVWPDEPPRRAFVADEPVQQQVQAHDEAAMPVTPAETPEPVTEAPTMETVTEQAALQQHAEPDAIQSDALQQFSAANREAIGVLNDRTGSAEQRIARLEAQIHALTQRPAIAPEKATPSPKLKAPSAAQRPRVSSPATTRTVSSGSVKGWQVHTVYPGMAWITRDGSTWSVQPGDVLHGLSIRSIDAKSRTVTTDKGVIRQGG